MKSSSFLSRFFLGGISVLALTVAGAAQAGTPDAAAPTAPPPASAVAPSDQGIGDIIVTAQKRSQSINNVGISIVAATGSELRSRGITDPAELVKIVPGFIYTPTAYATPVYTLRGVGLYDNGISSSPAVSVYVDQVALPFPAMTTGVGLDLERVEVLKGPQGTLFGQNATGGAINYIAAKPTDRLETGGSLSYERFGKIDGTGYISGPLSDTVRARLAVRAVEGGDWQYSVTRPNDQLGASRQLIGRLLLDWDASDRLTLHFNANGFHDRSDTQQPQFVSNVLNISAAPNPLNPYAVVNPAAFAAITNPSSPGYQGTFLARQAEEIARLNSSDPIVAQGAREMLGEPVTPNNARAADWSAASPSRLDNKFGQLSLRADYKLADEITLTSISAGEYFHTNVYTDLDATPAQGIDYHGYGSVKGFNQELRLAGNSSRLNWVAGLNYDYQTSTETQAPLIKDLSNSANEVFTTNDTNLTNTIKTYAAFGNAEYKLNHTLSFQGALRYTDNKQSAGECTSDPEPNQALSNLINYFQQVFVEIGLKKTPIVNVQPNQCFQLMTDLTPAITPTKVSLNEHNVSWRFGLTNKFDSGLLLYLSASRGYKAGIFSPLTASSTVQYDPAKQERLDAYEAGFKAPLFDRRVQLNGAAFYYNYKDKQLRSRVNDPLFGLLEKLINVPKSRVWGIEGEVVAEPVDGVRLTASGTYLNSKILASNAVFYNQPGFLGNFAGSPIPFTPKFTGVADAEYGWAVGRGLRATMGASLTYHSKDIATFITDALPADDFKMPGYALLDLRAGIGRPDNSWNVQIFGRNVTNKYYYNGVYQDTDTTYRYAGRPATYGILFSAQFK